MATKAKSAKSGKSRSGSSRSRSVRTKSAPKGDTVKLVRLGGEEVPLPLTENGTVGSVLEAADETLEGHAVFVNGEEAGAETELSPGDTVHLAPGIKLG
jgi:hypothetical protein